MIINGREIGPHHSPYIVFEASCNHNGSLENAMKLIRVAKEAGADAIKWQAYTADTITIDHNSDEFIVQSGPWKGSKLHQLYSTTQTPFEWFPTLFGYAKTIGITPFASVFDKSSVDMLEQLNCSAYKIASMEITDVPLIEYVASTGKPLMISTGMASYDEISMANFAAIRHTHHCAILHCTSDYPSKASDTNLRQMGKHSSIYGISDHTVGDSIPIAATALGAQIIEKHGMLGIEDTEDYEFSMDPIQFKMMVREVRNIWQAMQTPKTDVEASSRQLRRSLYVVKDIEVGERFTEENIRSIRPAYGMEPRKLPWVLTKIAAQSLSRGTALKPEHIAEVP